MSIQENLKSKLPNSRNGIVKFMGETLHVSLLSQREYREQKFDGTDASTVGFIAEKFFDPSSGKPAFTKEFLQDELPYAKLMELLRLYFRAQSGGGMEETEKN